MTQQKKPWRGGRVVDCTGLENRRTERYRGFESLSLRKKSGTTKLFLILFYRDTENLFTSRHVKQKQNKHRRCLLISCKGPPTRDGRAKRSQSLQYKQQNQAPDYLQTKKRICPALTHTEHIPLYICKKALTLTSDSIQTANEPEADGNYTRCV